MKRTHKLRLLHGTAAAVIESSRNLSEAARRLNVHRSTVQRWVRSGRMPAPHQHEQIADLPPEAAPDWASAVRVRYALTATEGVLLDLAERALALARDDAAKPQTRLSATARFQQLVKQLNLEPEHHGEAQTGVRRPFPRQA